MEGCQNSQIVPFFLGKKIWKDLDVAQCIYIYIKKISILKILTKFKGKS
jgi:hypothetical protein